MWNSQIIKVTAGSINGCNDTVIGGVAGIDGVSKYAGQLGAPVWLGDSQLIYNSAIGTVFGGRFRYVRLAAAATAVVVGAIVFWDISVADNLYQVTTSEASSVPGAQLRAGIVLNNGWTPGNYSFIQDVGPTFVKFRAALSTAPAGVGVAVYAAAAGTGADNGFADTISSSDPALFSDVTLMQNRYIGAAIQLPTNGGLKLTNVNFANLRG
ncbi:MAG: hypothetical protein ACRD3J_17345 [Thermoanaerobaculia bacterium]